MTREANATLLNSGPVMATQKAADGKPSPLGYITKSQAARRLGMSIKTLDRRMASEACEHIRVLRIGTRVFLRQADVEAYFKLCEQRGYI